MTESINRSINLSVKKILSTKSTRKRAWAWLAPLEHSRLKIAAARQNRFMEELVLEAIREYLDRHEHSSAVGG